MKIWIVLAIKQIENKIYVDNENSFYIAGVYSKKEQAEKAAANLEIVRGGKYKCFISKQELKNKFKIEPYKTFEK